MSLHIPLSNTSPRYPSDLTGALTSKQFSPCQAIVRRIHDRVSEPGGHWGKLGSTNMMQLQLQAWRLMYLSSCIKMSENWCLHTSTLHAGCIGHVTGGRQYTRLAYAVYASMARLSQTRGGSTLNSERQPAGWDHFGDIGWGVFLGKEAIRTRYYAPFLADMSDLPYNVHARGLD